MEQKSLSEVQIYTDEEGKKIVVLQDVKFKGKEKEEWDLIEDFLKEYVGKHYQIVETCEKVFIGKEFPDEFTHGKDKIILKRANARAKANASLVIGELIQIGANKSETEDYGGKHGKLAKNGWYRYDTRIAIPMYNDNKEVIRHNIYKLRILVRHDEDGKLYLYDFLHTKKEKETCSPL